MNEQMDSVDIGIDEQLSEILNNRVSLANPVVSVGNQQVSLEAEDCQKNESKEGDCHIFNYQEFIKMEPRKGSGKDAERLKHDFTQLNLDVHTHINLLYEDTFTVLKEAANKDYSNCKYFVCCFLTHGSQNILWAKDRRMNIDDILTIFSESSSLKGIPKIFIMQACRGDKAELATSMESTDSGLLTETEEYLDFLIVNSTYLDTVSFKTSDEEEDKCHGSFFINEFCNSLEQFSGTLDLIQILTIVNYCMANIFLSHYKKDIKFDEKKQMSCFTSTLRKKVEFNKKIEKFETADTRYFEKRRKRHGSGNDRTNYPVLDFKYDIKKPKRVFFLSVVNEKIGEGDIPLRRAIHSLWSDFAIVKYTHKDFRGKFRKSDVLKFLAEGSNLFGARNECNPKKSSEVDCLICYIAAYSRYDSICDAKGRKISKKEVVEKFIGQQNKSFVGKPKIFIFLLRKLLEEEKLPDERFCDDFESSVESSVNSEYSGKGYGISTDSAGEIDKNTKSTDNKFDAGIVPTDGIIIGENLLPVHADILEICITVTDWKQVIEPMGLFRKMLKKNPTEDLLSLLTKFNFELVEKHNFFQIPTTMPSSCKSSRSSFSMTSTLTKTMFWP